MCCVSFYYRTKMRSRIFLIVFLIVFTESNAVVTTDADVPIGNLQYIYTETNPTVQAEAAQEALRRLLPSRHTDFVLNVEPSLTDTPYTDAFHIEWDESVEKLIVTGTTGVAALFGLHDYLKYECKCHFAWEGSQTFTLPLILPKVNVTRQILDRFRYYQNVCTDSYSFVWWEWEEWEEHIDWMALNGINLPLAFTGQEAIWRKVYLDLGLSNEDIEEYIAGPAFLAWWRMGNLHNWGGPLPDSFITGKFELLKKIVERMTSLGMIPVLPAFSGSVPEGLMKIYPNASVIRHPNWSGFNESYSSNFLLLPTDPLFIEIGRRYVQQITEDLGTAHVYSCDTFNENRPSSNDPVYLRQMAESTYASMVAGDEKAVWLMQAWLFYDDDFWEKEQVRSYLSGIPVGNAIVLDLQAELDPLYLHHESFHNHSFIWCMLHNYGATHGFYGVLGRVNDGVDAARNGENTLIGTGLCPEGIHQNYIVYDFMSESSLRENPVDLPTWASQFQERRYGLYNQDLELAWQLLMKGVYNADNSFRYHGRSFITRRPNFNLQEPIWYEVEDLRLSVTHFATFLNSNLDPVDPTSFLIHDVIDFMRQLLQVISSQIYTSLVSYYNQGDLIGFTFESGRLLELFDDLDTLLSTNENFMLGPWVSSAEGWGQGDTATTQLMRFNSLNQITLWGPSGEIVDYAAKQWAGVVSGFLKPRWTSFINGLNTSLIQGESFNYGEWRETVLKEIEIPFTLTQEPFPVNSTGDAISEALRIFSKWNTLLH